MTNWDYRRLTPLEKKYRHLWSKGYCYRPKGGPLTEPKRAPAPTVLDLMELVYAALPGKHGEIRVGACLLAGCAGETELTLTLYKGDEARDFSIRAKDITGDEGGTE